MRKVNVDKIKKIHRKARKFGKLSMMPLLVIGVMLASMHGAFIGNARESLTLTDFGYRITKDAHTPDDFPLAASHYVAFDTKHLRNIRYDDGKDGGHVKHFGSASSARNS